MKLLSLVLCTLVGYVLSAKAGDQGGQPGTGVQAGSNATHILRISGDTLVVATGSTYVFTVDTHPDSGLVSTRPTVPQLLSQLTAQNGAAQQYVLSGKNGTPKTDGLVETGDRLSITGGPSLYVLVRPAALSGKLQLERNAITQHTRSSVILYFTAGQRSPAATVKIYIPAGISVTPDNTTVNVIGRGDVKLKDLATQSIGRVGSKYSYSKVGTYAITPIPAGTLLTLSGLDLRPANGADIKLVIADVSLGKAGRYAFKATYTTAVPEVLTSAGTGTEVATLDVTPTIADFHRETDGSLQYRESAGTYTTARFSWSPVKGATGIQLMQSVDEGKTWAKAAANVDVQRASATVKKLLPGKRYSFRLIVKDGPHKGFSNIARCYSGKMDIKQFGATGEEKEDCTEKVNQAIAYLHSIGGGTLLFSPGTYSVRTVHLQSNVYLYIDKAATIKALKGADAPETTWFSDKKYRSGLSPTDAGPYEDPENYMTKQDVGHHYFRNTMFFGERLDNIKIIGNGRITGNGNLVTGDKVMNNAPDNRADKMFTLKLCTNIEIGGIHRAEDLWYDETKDAPYYIGKKGEKITDTGNMLQIDRGGHFVLLATGSDHINVHNTYFGQHGTSNARDIYDFMACNDVTVTNIYSKVSSDDIVKPGSDCSLGFTRPVSHHRVRNIIGDTNCNLFQIGSETADDIMDICVDNIYILGANKAGFSISTNDGAHIKDIHLNCGHTGAIHSRSKMYRSYTPFFISISNRARILGAEVGKYAFTDNGVAHHELLVKNVNIGQVENIILNGIDIYEVYAGSSFSGQRWKAYDGSQRRSTPIVAGYGLPAGKDVQGGLDFKLPNGKHTGYIKNVVFNDVHVLVKGTNPASDTAMAPPELGVGQYNASNLKVLPSYGLWARHVNGLTVTNSSFNFEKPDGRYAIMMDDVHGARISGVKMVKTPGNNVLIKLKNSTGVDLEKSAFYNTAWGSAQADLPARQNTDRDF
ncbi:endopygalactorunase [Chitinophaga lutea]|uniref:Endopygalactorunase n=1 Tax=Chitinophaga lutea TaxID=2488634 RepID=A0A3N4PPP5_9BACT|nr:endopygalactorunase [Chitinophaga lutea]RPE09705.1 endopygalactorunase [Chitinophaga lutea]